MDSFLRPIRRLIPARLFKRLQPLYHYSLSFLGAVRYNFPSKKLYVIGITGTKGKSSTTEMVNAILEEAGIKTALISTIRFKTGDSSEKNLHKMSMPGRFFIQHFMQNAVAAGCTHLILEMTSEGTKQFRHKNIALDALIFSNISPEHIEAHGSFENYLAAKLSIRDALSASTKKNKVVVANSDDDHGKDFLNVDARHKLAYSLSDVSVTSVYPSISFDHSSVMYISPLQGEFNIYNMLSAITLALHMDIPPATIQKALSKLSVIPGRVEHISVGQNFDVAVDYAHTADSLKQLYVTFEGLHKVCVLGSCGGGRDTWKRPEMAKVAESYCDEIILTNEDPYDEDPKQIIDDMLKGMEHTPTIVMDRREAIAESFKIAKEGSIVLITGKGTDPFIMGASGEKLSWSDASVAREELEKLTNIK